MLTKIIATGIVSIMSFLGYSPKDYYFFTPPPIKAILEQNISDNKNTQTSTTTENISQEKVLTETQAQTEKKTQPKNQTTASNTTTKKNSTQKKVSPISTTSPAQKEKPLNIFPNPAIEQPFIPKVAPVQNSGTSIPSTASVNQKISSAVVNIYCQAVRGSYIETITGSAVQIDPSGVYLTNAHVAMYVMLSDTESPGTVSCYIREGSPAKKIYEANSVYIPSGWIYSHTNAYKLGIELTGTGEKDYALVKKGASNPNLSPNQFPAEWSAPLASNLPSKGQNIILSGYPVFDKSVISSALFAVTNNSSVLNSFNLNGEPNALLDSDSTKMAQIGSSGGGAFDESGNLFGIMDAEIKNTPGELPSERIIGINYIKNDILRDTGKSFANIISNADSESENFIKNSAPALSKVLINNK